MESTLGHPSAVRAPARLTARILKTVVVLFLLADGLSHIVMPAPVVEAFQRTGVPLYVGPLIGILMIALLALYLVPRTSVLGGVLLVGYLGGAVATNLHAASPPFETIFPVLVGALVWAPLVLTDNRAKEIFR